MCVRVCVCNKKEPASVHMLARNINYHKKLPESAQDSDVFAVDDPPDAAGSPLPDKRKRNSLRDGQHNPTILILFYYFLSRPA